MAMTYVLFKSFEQSPGSDIFFLVLLLGVGSYLLYRFMIKPITSPKIDPDAGSLELGLNKIANHGVLVTYLNERSTVAGSISVWLKKNIHDGDPVSKLFDPELMNLFKRDQELYLKIKELDPSYLEPGTIEPMELHRLFVEIAQGKYKTSH